MAEVYGTIDVQKLLENKFVIIMGDSVQRCIYKDLICALQKDEYLKDVHLRKKGENSIFNDELMVGGNLQKMTNGTNYKEVRQFVTDFHLVKFFFVTRCYNNYVEEVLKELRKCDIKPDVFIMNSCLWDISRYGANSVKDYQKNLVILMKRLKVNLPKDCLVIWNSTLPISSHARGGFIIPEIETMTSTLRLDIIFANNFARKTLLEAGFDVLDLHFFLRHQIHRRAGDGVHWDMTAHRRITNLLMTQIAEAWNQDLPNNITDDLLKEDLLSIVRDYQPEDNVKNNKVLSAAIKARPKVKAKRRIPGPHISPIVIEDDSPRSVVIHRNYGDVNLPTMGERLESYGALVTPLRALRPHDGSTYRRSNPRVLFTPPSYLNRDTFYDGQSFPRGNPEVFMPQYFHTDTYDGCDMFDQSMRDTVTQIPSQYLYSDPEEQRLIYDHNPRTVSGIDQITIQNDHVGFNNNLLENPISSCIYSVKTSQNQPLSWGGNCCNRAVHF